MRVCAICGGTAHVFERVIVAPTKTSKDQVPVRGPVCEACWTRARQVPATTARPAMATPALLGYEALTDWGEGAKR
jgi:hypothetical protein